ncbi:MAG: response regulator transcription factor [Phycisphaerae bacterium]|nr:response regulator transcription factor [Phycisphaerae bacterium]
MIRILIADDHTLVRQGLRRLLEEEKDFRVVAEAGDGAEVMRLVGEQPVDVVLMDIAMPGMDGFEATKRLTKKKGGPRVLVLTMYADEHYAARLLRIGAMGYVVKDAAATELVEAVRTVHEGRRFVSASIREHLALRYIDGLGDDAVESLTNREFQVLRYLAAGSTNREIAKQLGLSVKTVDAHRLNILAKLGLRNNSELTKFALRHHLITD